MQFGKNKKLKLLEISEFNPAVESTRTKVLLAELLYTFIRGVWLRNK